MGEPAEVATSRKAWALAASAVVVVGLLGVTQRDRDGGAPASTPVPEVPDAPESAPPAVDVVAGTDAPEPTAPIELPGFDVVRVAPDGSALVAGRAAPGARVTITADASALAEAEVDDDGNFVAIFRAEPSREPRALTLDAEAPDGSRTASEEVVVLLPGADAAGEAVPAAVGQNATAATAPESDGAVEPDGAAKPEVAVTAIVRPDSIEVVGADPAAQQVALASISYAEAGAVTLSGTGTAGAEVRAYVDDGLARSAVVDADGRWSLDLGDVERGLYRLRIDQLARDGSVASRVETPFQRDFPAAPRPRPGSGTGDGPGGSITVQPGSNLWTIAQLHYGSGVRYTQIFTANRALIRDPDLIYPGQVLDLPGAEETD